jgi:hypothetical protein
MYTHEDPNDDCVFDAVVTYRYAYTDGVVSLCDEHADTHPRALGPVEYGRHPGFCHDCDASREKD